MYKNKSKIALLLVALLLLAVGCQSNIGMQASTSPSGAPSTSSESSPSAPSQGNVLVVYFSATGNTATIAEWIAGKTGATLHEITPAQPYTSADLEYRNAASRTSQENDDAASRPAISGTIDLSSYDTIFLGYPIWWGEAPKIIYTFLESHDFSGKTIIAFCTSSSSGIGASATNLAGLTDVSATWLSGERFSSSTTEDNVAEWVSGLGLANNI